MVLEVIGRDLEQNSRSVTLQDNATGADLQKALENAFGKQVQTMSYQASEVELHHKLKDLGMKSGDCVTITNGFSGGIAH